MQYYQKQSGFSLVETIIVAALSTLVFGALFISFHYSLELIHYSRAKLSALSVATDRMEYFRSLPYDDVGTLAGIPAGIIPQNSTTTLNGIDFSERVLVEYVDDDADGKDGTGTPDSNGIPADYKRVKVEYTWEMAGESNSIFLVSNIVPRSIETTAGGGTVRVNVIDQDSAVLPNATVRLINNTASPNIDVTRFTDATGAALFSGAPAESDYEVIVTASISGADYSTAETYQATPANPNPIVAPFSVLEADVSTLTFQIGELSDLEVTTLSATDDNHFVEGFEGVLTVASSSGVATSGSALVLDDSAGVYKSSGIAYVGPITPTTLEAWQTLRIIGDAPINSDYAVQFFTSTSTGVYTRIPDADLPGNAAGFTDTINDISALDAATYGSIYVGVQLTSSDTAVTPQIDEVSVHYRENSSVLPTANFDIRGVKIIGTDGSGQPIYKYSDSVTTDSSGEVEIPDLEFDSYTIEPQARDIASACPAHPFEHRAGVHSDVELVLVPDAINTLRTTVVDALGRTISGVEVNVSRAGYDVTSETDGCGQVFFTGGLSDADDYTATITATGYTTEVVTDIEISGDILLPVTLQES